MRFGGLRAFFLSTENVLPSDLEYRVRRTVEALETTPAKNRRGIIENLIQFAEFHPTKIKLGVYTASGAAPRGYRPFGPGDGGSRGNVHFRSKLNSRGLQSSHTIKVGGEGEIRTHETCLGSTRFRIERLRPLGHLSA